MKSHNHETTKPCCQEKSDLVSSKDPVCGMNVSEKDNSLHHEFQGTDYYFCSSHCLKAFTKNPIAYLSAQGEISMTSGNNRPVVFGTLGFGILFLIFFGVDIPYSLAMPIIFSMYLIASVIPGFVIFDWLVKGSVAISLFGFYGVNEIIVLCITGLMWICNFALPSLIGMFFVLTFDGSGLRLKQSQVLS